MLTTLARSIARHWGFTKKGNDMFGLTPIMPAYGRDYTSAKTAQADFDAGKDFDQ